MYNNGLSRIWSQRKMWLIVPGRMLQAASRAPGEWPGHFWCNRRCSSWHHIMVFVSVFPFSQMSLQSLSTVLHAAKVTSSHSFTGSPGFFWPVSRISFSKKFYVNILLKNYFAYIKYYYRKTCVGEAWCLFNPQLVCSTAFWVIIYNGSHFLLSPLHYLGHSAVCTYRQGHSLIMETQAHLNFLFFLLLQVMKMPEDPWIKNVLLEPCS